MQEQDFPKLSQIEGEQFFSSGGCREGLQVADGHKRMITSCVKRFY